MQTDGRKDVRRRVLAQTARWSLAAAVLGALGGWYGDGFVGAVVGAALMGLFFAPCVGLIAYLLIRPSDD